MVYDIAILGAGPAGLTAAIYSARKKLKTLIVSKDIGGQAAISGDIENYLGFSMITGPELAQKFQDHLDEYKEEIDLKQTAVTSVEKNEKDFLIKTESGNFEAKTIIVALGKVPRLLNVPGEKEYKGRGVTYCATCDAPLFKEKEVAVIGGGNSALDAAYQLTKIAKKVFLISKGEDFSKADEILFGKVQEAGNVEIFYNKETLEITGDKLVSGLKIKDRKDSREDSLDVQGVFVEIGSIPSTEFLKDLLELNKWGEIEIDKKNQTSVAGVFAAGDATDVIEKQIIVAAGEGCKASLMASEYLSRRK